MSKITYTSFSPDHWLVDYGLAFAEIRARTTYTFTYHNIRFIEVQP